MTRKIVVLLLVAGVLLVAGWGGNHVYEELRQDGGMTVPATKVKRGDVVFHVTAQGALQGGKSQVLTAPMTGSRELTVTMLRQPGVAVDKGEVVAEFDTTEETYKLREAEADLGEAEMQVKQSEFEAKAREEELNYEIIKARGDLQVAEIECTRNPLIAVLAAKQNDIVRESAKERVEKLERDFPARKAAAVASTAIQIAAREKAKMMAATARRNIDMMTLRAPMAGYVSVERNQNSNIWYQGMQLPLLQVGDTVRPGMPVVQIPDMSSWEASAEIGEDDRGQIALGQTATIELVALPAVRLQGVVSNMGGTTGPPWNRRFECKLSVKAATPDVRPGMSARIVIATHQAKSVLWIPAQAMYESDGRKFVYLEGPGGFSTKDIRMVRRGESQVIVDGLQEGDVVALANPIQNTAASKTAGGAAKAIAK
ncbi:MAG TPA: HlyD family efflux transporter periplasmic adaptor subunit [Bryobacteraceae bacterium]|nr:HlyD family efflux transporter periplasmic adaptor subunit [Bryobacteraceae bacterium]